MLPNLIANERKTLLKGGKKKTRKLLKEYQWAFIKMETQMIITETFKKASRKQDKRQNYQPQIAVQMLIRASTLPRNE